MKFNQYSDIAASTAFYPGQDQGSIMAVLYTAIGLGGEAGEIQNKIKKVLRDDDLAITDERRAALLDEAGDVLWYLDRFVHELGSTLEQVADSNLAKLLARQVAGTLSGSGDVR